MFCHASSIVHKKFMNSRKFLAEFWGEFMMREQSACCAWLFGCAMLLNMAVFAMLTKCFIVSLSLVPLKAVLLQSSSRFEEDSNPTQNTGGSQRETDLALSPFPPFTPKNRQLLSADILSALTLLYSGTGGSTNNWVESWQWMTGNDPCGDDWYGVYCQSGEITELRLSHNSLSGSLPTQLGLLSSCTHLEFVSNDLQGQVPSEIGRMSKLQDGLILVDNSFSGSLPSELGLFTRLNVSFSLSFNQFSGSIPSQLGSLTNLSSFGLWANQLQHSIPSELGRLSKLTDFFVLGSNQLTGTIPSELGQMTKLVQYFYLGYCSLSGLIPSELGRLTKLTTGLHFQLNTNQLCGDVPSEVSASFEWYTYSGNHVGTPCCDVNPKFCVSPTFAPSSPVPTLSSQPTPVPSPQPTPLPTSKPTPAPSHPTQIPTPVPTSLPTLIPSPLPTFVPSSAPTVYCVPGEYLDNSNDACTPCPLGEYSNNLTAPFPTFCRKCGLGTYSSTTGAVVCTPCPVGKISVSDRSSCSNCNAGKYVNSTGNSQCQKCAPGKYSERGAALCTECPSGKMQQNSGQDFCYVCSNPDWCVDATTCRKGHKGNGCSICTGYRYFDEDDQACNKCPKNSGFILLGACLLGILLCVIAYSISGMGTHDEERKKSGRGGDSDDDHDDDSSGSEERDEKQKSKNGKEAALSEVARPAVEGVGELPHKDEKHKHAGRVSHKSAKSFALFNMSINYLQLSVVYFSISVKYPHFFEEFLGLFNVLISFDFMKLAPPECSTGSLTFFKRWLISILMPLSLMLPFIYMSLRGRGPYRYFERQVKGYLQDSRVSPQSRTKALMALILLMNALYIFEVEKMISAVRCKKEADPDERPLFPPWQKDEKGNPLIMIDAPEIACSNRANSDGNPTYNVIFFLSCTFIVLLSFGVSFGSIVLSKLNPTLRRKLQLDLRDGYIWWGSLVNVFKLSVILVSSLLPHKPGAQNWIMMLLSLFMGFLVLLVRPHEIYFSKFHMENIRNYLQERHYLSDKFVTLSIFDIRYEDVERYLLYVKFMLEEEWEQLVLTGDGNNIGEGIFFFLQFLLLSFQRLGYFGLIGLDALGVMLLIFYCAGLLWSAFLSRSILGSNARSLCDLFFTPIVYTANCLKYLVRHCVALLNGGNARRFAHESNEDVVVVNDNIELGDGSQL